MSRAVLHIGMEKTGTTFLQASFLHNRLLLEARGVRYPAFGPKTQDHSALSVPFVRKTTDVSKRAGVTSVDQLPALRDKLGAILTEDAARWPTCLISAEHLSSRLVQPAQVQDLKEFLAAIFDEVTVIVYLRRQDFSLPSLYSTAVQSGATARWEVRDYLVRLEDGHQLRDVVTRWEGAFGAERVRVRPYLERYKSSSEDLLGDLAAHAGFALPPGWSRARTAGNARLGAEALEVLRILNPTCPRFNEQRLVNPRRKHFVTAVAKAFPGPSFGPSEEDAEVILDACREDNDTLIAGLRETGQLDPIWDEWLGQVAGEDGTVGLPQLSPEQVVEAVITLQAVRSQHLWWNAPPPESPSP